MRKIILHGANNTKLRDLNIIESILYYIGLFNPDVIVLDFNGKKIPKVYCK